MKARAAIAIEAGKPLEVDEIDLEGPRQGECLVRMVATGGCQTDAVTLAGDDPKRRALLITQLVHTVLDTFLVNPEVREFIPFVLREIFVPGPGFERMYDAIPRRVHETFTRLVAWILDLDSQSPATVVRTHAVIGQLIVFHVGRAILTRRLGVDDYSEDDIRQIKLQATQSVLMSLGLPHD